MATTEERNTSEKASAFSQRVENMGGLGDAKINKGAIVVLDSNGKIVPAGDNAGERPLGRAEETVAAVADRPANVTTVKVRSGVFLLNGTVSGPTCVLVDDETVANSGTADFELLVVENLGAKGAYVKIDPLNNAAS